MRKSILFSVITFTFFFLPDFVCAQNWDWAYSSSGSSIQLATGVAVDGTGNVYVTGFFDGGSITFGTTTITSAGNRDIFLVKYSPCGNVLWAKNFGGASYDASWSVATDATGNVFVTGYIEGTATFGSFTLTPGGTNPNVFIVKCNSAGVVQWAKNSSGSTPISPGTLVDNQGHCVSTDAAGNAYITGWFATTNITFAPTTLTNASSSGVAYEVFVVKYDALGNMQWAKSAQGTQNDFGNSIAADNFGNVYVTGSHMTTINFGNTSLVNTTFNSDMFLVKYNASTGADIWSTKGIPNNTSGPTEIGQTVATDAPGNIYVGGQYGSPYIIFGTDTLFNSNTSFTQSYDYFIAKYDSAGVAQWAQSGGSASGNENGASIAVDTLKGVYLTGTFTSSSITIGTNTLFKTGTSDPMFIAEYDVSGNVLCATSLDNGVPDYDNVMDIATDSFGQMYLAGDFAKNPFMVGSTSLALTGTYNTFSAKFTCGPPLPYAQLSASATATSAACSSPNGSATATGTGGSSPYTFQWSNGATSASLSGLAAGNYTVTVTDANGCSDTSTTTIIAAASPTVTTSSSTAGCSSATGTAAATVSGGTSPYTYLWSNSATSASLSGLPAGNYSVTVTDNNGCTASATATVATTGGGPVITTNSVAANCTASDGSATATATGGTSPYSYNWSNGATSASLSGLPAGTYTVTVTNAGGGIPFLNGSFESTTGTCNYNLPNATFNSMMNDNTAFGSNSQIDIINSSCGYGAAQQGNFFIGLAVDITNTLTDALSLKLSSPLIAGNTYTLNFYNKKDPGFTANLLEVGYSVDSVSFGTAIDTAALPSTNWGLVSFTFTPSFNSQFITVRTIAGSYGWNHIDNFSVSGNACSSSAVVVVSSVNTVSVTASSTSVSCNGGNNGTASLTVNGGASPYSYLWSNGAASASLSGLGTGIYYVTVTDSSGCTSVDSATVTQPTAFSIATNVINDTCAQGNGTVAVIISGGTSPYTYLWNTGVQTQNLASLQSGNYSLTITDSNGCDSTISATVNNTGGIVPVVTANGSTTFCQGDSVLLTTTTAANYQWSNGDTTQSIVIITSGNYLVTVSDTSGCSGVSAATTVTVNSLPNVLLAAFSNACVNDSVYALTGGSPAGGTYSGAGVSGNNFNPLLAGVGNYAITYSYTDGTTGCSDTATNTIIVTAQLDATVSPAGPYCKEDISDTLSAATSGGNWSGTGVSSSGIFNPATAGAGTHQIIYSISGNCGDADTIQISVSAYPVANAGADVSILPGQSVNLSGTGGGTYQWTPSAGLSCDTCASPQASPEQTTTYVLLVTNANGCNAEDSVTITVDEKQPYISVPNIFSPDGDGNNDFIRVHGFGIKEFKLTIYDRWGEKIFTTTDKSIYWDGTFRGNSLNSAVFVYFLDATFDNATEFHEKGNITLLR